MFLYSAVSSPLDPSKRFTFFLPWETCSFRHQLGFSWKHSSHAAIAQRLFTHISTRYSFIQLSEQGCQWRERKCPIFETVAKGDSNPGSLDCESIILPLSYRALCIWTDWIRYISTHYKPQRIPKFTNVLCRHDAVHLGRGCPWTREELVDEETGKLVLLNQLPRFLKVLGEEGRVNTSGYPNYSHTKIAVK